MKKHFKTVVTELGPPTLGKVFATTKGNLKYSGMSKEEFRLAVEDNQCYEFEIVEF